MIHHLKRVIKKKSVLGFLSALTITGTIIGVQANKPAEPPRYVLARAAKGTLVLSVNGTGQVSGENTVNIKPLISGTLTKLAVRPGETVKTGATLFEIEQKDALKAVRDESRAVHDAQLNVQAAEISLAKLRQPADAASILQAENAVAQAKRALQDLKDGADELDIKQAEQELENKQLVVEISSDDLTPTGIRKAYDDATQDLKDTTQTLFQSLTDADSILGIDNSSQNDAYERQLSALDTSKLFTANAAYQAAKTAVNDLKTTTDSLASINEQTSIIENALVKADSALALMTSFLQQVQDVLTNTLASASYSQTSLDALRGSVKTDISNVSAKQNTILTAKKDITDAKNNYQSDLLNVEKARIALDKLKRGADASELAAAEEKVAEAIASLKKLQQGTDALDIKTAENSVAQRRSAVAAAVNRLNDAKDSLKDYIILAPLDGVVTDIPVKPGDPVSASIVLASLETSSKIAEISLNEVDVTRIKVGQKATLTFDAVTDLTITGVVSEVDSTGTASQGVVNYGVKIRFDTSDDRIKSGMTASANIITEVKTDAILVPNAAVLNDSQGIYVNVVAGVDAQALGNPQGVLSQKLPERKLVGTGLANEQSTEIISGLNEGETVVTRTIEPETKTTAPQSASPVRIQGMGGFGGTFRSR